MGSSSVCWSLLSVERRTWAHTPARAHVRGEVCSSDEKLKACLVPAVSVRRSHDINWAAAGVLRSCFFAHAPPSWCGAALLVRPLCAAGGGAGCQRGRLLTHPWRVRGSKAVGPL
ncbi:hypothetical protein NDU88_002868 [Pleurodeles waltl]|uniref:Secreted protein n=1 Tax=Pleurodeles waltl TaxID=8319 RepID=A0AAV7W3M6_PLEWA|nr:hypothetical protein NDU88_002868 [Pleurodeles waltl]